MGNVEGEGRDPKYLQGDSFAPGGAGICKKGQRLLVEWFSDLSGNVPMEGNGYSADPSVFCCQWENKSGHVFAISQTRILKDSEIFRKSVTNQKNDGRINEIIRIRTSVCQRGQDFGWQEVRV